MKKEIKSAQIKEDNGGGIQIECYDADDKIVAVVSGIEYAQQSTAVADIIGLVDGDWDYTDATLWYDSYGNSIGNQDETSRELAASDVVNDDESTHVIAEYYGKTLTIFVNAMGCAGRKYFGLK